MPISKNLNPERLRKMAECITNQKQIQVAIHKPPRRGQHIPNNPKETNNARNGKYYAKKKINNSEALLIRQEGISYTDLLKEVKQVFVEGNRTLKVSEKRGMEDYFFNLKKGAVK